MNTVQSTHERIKKYAQSDISVLFQELRISGKGYTEREACENRLKYGINSSVSMRGGTVLSCMYRSFINPFTVTLLVISALSFSVYIFQEESAVRNGMTTLIMLSMVMMSGILRLVRELRAKRAADRVVRAADASLPVLRDGKWGPLPAGELVVGDTVRLIAGGRAPADIRLLDASDLYVSQAALTGEHAIQEKRAESFPECPASLGACRNIVFAGSLIVSGEGTGIALAVGGDTARGDMPDMARGRGNSFNRGAASIAWVLLRFMAVLVPVIFIVCGLVRGDWGLALPFALAVAVGLVPEMLPMVIAACLARGSAVMKRQRVIVKDMNAMQSFGSMDTLCVDKTGTLTSDSILLEYYMDILGNESAETLDYAYLNSLYHTGARNPLDAAVLRCRSMPGKEGHFASLARRYPRLDEQPFDHERRLASVLVRGERENLLIVKGGVWDVCGRCTHAAYRGERKDMREGGLEGVRAVADELLKDGMKVLAVAYRSMGQACTCSAEDENGLVLVGYLAFFDTPRKSAAGALRRLRELHVDVKVLTGDQRAVAVSVCRRLGMDAARVLTGRQMELMRENELPVHIERTEIFAELSPRQKARIVSMLRDNGHTVGFLGDGMNDLPAMAVADVGISVDTAVETVRESSDAILLEKDLNVLERGILEGRRTFVNMSKYIRITASSNFGNICSIVAASLCLPFLPMTAVQILLLNLLYDTLCLALPWDRVAVGLRGRPGEWSGDTLGRFMLFFGPLSSIFDLVTFAFLYFVLCPSMYGGSFGSLPPVGQAGFIMAFHTGWFLESLWTQTLILHLLRTGRLPLLQSRPALPVLAVAGAGITLFTAMTFTPLGTMLGLTALPPLYFAFLALVVPAYMLLVSGAKALYVRWNRDLL